MNSAQDIAVRLLVSIASGAVLAVLCAPANLHYLHWFAYLPFFWVLREETPVANRWYALVYGTVAVAVIFRWIPFTITYFSNITMFGTIELATTAIIALCVLARHQRRTQDRVRPAVWAGFLLTPAAVVALGLQVPSIPVGGTATIFLLFCVGFGSPYFFLWSGLHPIRQRLGSGWILAFPAWLVTVEWLSMYVLLFPYQQGVTQFDFPLTWQLASITGVWGLSFLLMFFNAAIGEGLYREREGKPFPRGWVAAAVATLLIVMAYGSWRFERVEAVLAKAPILRVQQLQLDTGMQERMRTGPAVAFRQWMSETQKIPPGSVDLVIWSEGSTGYNIEKHHERSKYKDLSTLAKQGQFELLVGGGTVIFHRDERGKLIKKPNGSWHYTAYNSVYLIGKDGEVRGRYDKTVPLPFGEYLPLAGIFPWLKDLIQGPGNFQGGTVNNTLAGASYNFAAPICYEATLPSTCRAFPEPDLLVNVTNDAWFTGPATFQHGMLAAIRATELGVPLVRGAYTGYSFVAEPHGVRHSHTQSMELVNRPIEIRMATFNTFYKQWGDWFVYLCMGGLGLSWLVSPWYARRKLS